jgi:epoxyqueuosine reductase QueG
VAHRAALGVASPETDVSARVFPTVPDNVREVLCNRYEYVVAEKEIIPNLTGDIRLCDTCGDWCPQ